MQSLSLKMARQLVGCLLLILSVISVNTAWSSERRLLWQSRDQFVALENLEKEAEGPNEHPFKLSPETLTALLAAIEVRTENTTVTEPLFTQESLQALVPQLHQALETATAHNDVTFAVIGLHRSLYGLAKSPKVTTGRLFRRDGHLNLILGMVQHDVNEREDRRLAPFIPGSRKQAQGGTWQLVQHAEDVFTLKRKDWIVFADAPAPMTINAPEPRKKMEQQQPPTPTPANTQQAPAETRGPVERMMILNELRNKGLISDEEYRTKRQQILNGL